MNAVTGVAGQLRLDEGDADGSSNEVRERATGLNSAPAAPGTGPAARARVTGDVIEIFHDAQVRVFSDAGLTRAQGEALAHRVEAAYTFDKKLQHWDRPAALAKPITVAALSDEKFAQVTGDRSGRVAGITTGRESILYSLTPNEQRSGETSTHAATGFARVARPLPFE